MLLIYDILEIYYYLSIAFILLKSIITHIYLKKETKKIEINNIKQIKIKLD